MHLQSVQLSYVIVLFIVDLILYYPFVKLQIKQNSIEAQNEGVTLE